MKLLGFSENSNFESLSPSQVLDALGITASVAELNYVRNVTSEIQSQLDDKQDSLQSSTSVTLNGTQLQRAALVGDVTADANSNTTTIANGVVTNAKLANAPTATLKGRSATGTGAVTDLTAAQVRSLLNVADGATVGASWGTNLTGIPEYIVAWANINPTTKFDKPSGSPYQFVAGDGTLQWIPEAPTSADFVATSGNQTGLSGNKTWTGTHTFDGGNIQVQGAVPIIYVEDTDDGLQFQFRANTGVAWIARNTPGDVLVRPNGITSTTGQLRVTPTTVSWDGNNMWHSGNFNPATKFDSPTGTTSQYIRGNGSLATFPTIPTNANFVATSGNQTGLSGNKTWTGTHTFGGDIQVFKSNAAVGVGVAALNGGLANYGNDGTGDVGIFSNHSGGLLRFRPNGRTSTSGQMTLNSSGNLNVDGGAYAVVFYANSFRSQSGSGDLCGSGTGTGIRLMPNGYTTTSMTDIAGNGNMTVRGAINATGAITASTVTVDTAGGTVGLLLDSSSGIIGGLSGIGGTTVSLHGEGNIIHISPNGRNATPRSTFHPDGSVTLGGHTTVNGTISDSIGNVRKPEFRAVNNTITLNSNDVNRIVEKSNNTSYTFTIPSGHGTHGDIITFVNSGTAGTLTINAATGVTIYRNGASGNIRVGPGSTVTVYRSATANRWIA